MNAAQELASLDFVEVADGAAEEQNESTPFARDGVQLLDEISNDAMDRQTVILAGQFAGNTTDDPLADVEGHVAPQGSLHGPGLLDDCVTVEGQKLRRDGTR